MTGKPSQPSIKVTKLHPDASLPQRLTEGASGFDLFACIPGKGTVALGRQPKLVGTGIAITALDQLVRIIVANHLRVNRQHKWDTFGTGPTDTLGPRSCSLEIVEYPLRKGASPIQEISNQAC